MKIPKQIRLPFGYTVRVKYKPKKKMQDCFGYWNDFSRTIYLRDDLEAQHRVYIFLHELLHATLDFQHWCVHQGYAGKDYRS